MDYLGAIGGIEDILMDLVAFLFGGYIQFSATIKAYEVLCSG